MSRFTDENLRGQLTNVSTVLNREREMKSEIAVKLKRLRAASSSLQNHITAIDDSYTNLTNVDIDEHRWRGTEKNKFDTSFQAMKDDTKEFMTKTDDARNQVESEIARYEAELLSVESTISNFERVLGNIIAEIDARRNN